MIGLGLVDAMRRVAPTLPRERYAELDRALSRSLPRAGCARSLLFDGVREMLAELEDAGHLLAIATGKSRAGLARAMAQQRVAERFVATRCADEGFPKPHPGHAAAGSWTGPASTPRKR